MEFITPHLDLLSLPAIDGYSILVQHVGFGEGVQRVNPCLRFLVEGVGIPNLNKTT